MSDSLLHQMMRKAAPPPPAAPPPAEPSRRSSIHGGRYARWHTELDYVPEEEGWMITYLDVVTLLLVMMVVMLAFAKPGNDGVHGKQPQKVATPVAQEGGSTIVPPLPLPFPEQNKKTGETSGQGTGQPKGVAKTGDQEADPLEALSLGKLGGDIKVTVGQRSVSFRISSELLFSSGEADLTPAGQKVVDQLLPVFNKAPDYEIVVEGHTDNMPIQTARFPSNWELAAARAGSVVRHLQNRGLNPTRLRATGLAETHPLGPNNTPEGRAANRRVEITMVAPQTTAGQ